jgi:hypothetical protein
VGTTASHANTASNTQRRGWRMEMKWSTAGPLQ